VSASARFAAAAPENTVAATVVRIVSGATPAERQEAIRQLEKYDWREDLLVATGLVAGAKNDPAQGVRIDCVRQLGARRVDHPQVVADLSALAAGDGDPVVRDEAAKALEQIRAKP
jgi:HEAT repeat protein